MKKSFQIGFVLIILGYAISCSHISQFEEYHYPGRKKMGFSSLLIICAGLDSNSNLVTQTLIAQKGARRGVRIWTPIELDFSNYHYVSASEVDTVLMSKHIDAILLVTFDSALTKNFDTPDRLYWYTDPVESPQVGQRGHNFINRGGTRDNPIVYLNDGIPINPLLSLSTRAAKRPLTESLFIGKLYNAHSGYAVWMVRCKLGETYVGLDFDQQVNSLAGETIERLLASGMLSTHP